VTEQLLTQQLESPSGTGRAEPRSKNQPVSYPHQRTGYQPADPILTGSSVCCIRVARGAPNARCSTVGHAVSAIGKFGGPR
jgi:hypothetical protein